MNQTDIDETIAETQRENDLRFAYIAGVGKGIEIMTGPESYTKEEFHQEIREGFREWLEE